MNETARRSDALYDVCVICGRTVEYTTSTPIAERFHYIDGGGQLCKACFAEYEKKLSIFSADDKEKYDV